jgi:hypothetical protein
MTGASPTHWPALAHRLDGSSDVYRLISIDARKVTTGAVAASVRCDACGRPVRCAVDSPRARIRRLRLTLSGTLIGRTACGTPRT